MITREPGKMAGAPCIRGLRITVAAVLAMLADGMSEQEILADYPDLVPGDVGDALRYALGRLEHERALVAYRCQQCGAIWPAKDGDNIARRLERAEAVIDRIVEHMTVELAPEARDAINEYLREFHGREHPQEPAGPGDDGP